MRPNRDAARYFDRENLVEEELQSECGSNLVGLTFIMPAVWSANVAKGVLLLTLSTWMRRAQSSVCGVPFPRSGSSPESLGHGPFRYRVEEHADVVHRLMNQTQ